MYSVGDVVNIWFPNQENNLLGTQRPAIVIEDLQNEIEVIFITKQLQQQKHYENAIIILKDSAEAIQMGLTHTSLIAIERKAQLKKITVRPPRRGTCPNDILDHIFEMLSSDK